MKKMFSRSPMVLVVFALCISLLNCNAIVVSAPASGGGNYLPLALMGGRYVQRWNDSTRTIRVNLESAPKLRGWDMRKTALVKSAFAEWEKVMAGRIRFMYTNSPYETDIAVTWRQKAEGEVIGLNASQWDRSMTLTNTDIEIALIRPDGRLQNDTEIYSTALHEMGHALGIKGHSNARSDIMYPVIQPNIIHLSARDIATMKTLYRMKPHVTNPIGISFARYKRFMAFAAIGYEAYQGNNYESAYQNFVKAESYYPKHPRLPFFVGVSAYQTDRYDSAIHFLDKASRVKGEDQSKAEFFLATVLCESGGQDAQRGKETAARQKFVLARQYYHHFLKSPDAPANLRRHASQNLAMLDAALAN